VFGHGFVRTIARYLGLDEEGLLGEYDLARGDKAPPAASRPEDRIPSPPKWLPAAAALVLLLLLIGLFYAGRYGWRRFAAHRAVKQSAGSSSDSPTQTESNSLAASPSAGSSSVSLALSVSTSAATRVRVLGDGKVLLDPELPAGETRRLTAHQQFEVDWIGPRRCNPVKRPM
jgi:cytoskeletal protein RodZ